jgi:hypothetical protein
VTSQSSRRADAIALAVLAGIITILFLDVLAGVNSLFIRDIVHYYYPAKHLLREIVLGGEFPYWNPWFGAGQPLAANPEHEVFYPLTWLILLPHFRTGFHLLTLVHVYIAAFGMYALLRSMRVRPLSSFLGALSFSIGVIAVSYLDLLPCLFSVAWLPLTCLYTRRFIRGRAWRDFAWAAFFFALQLLVAEPSTALQTGLLLGFYALFVGARERSVRPLLAVALISIAACAVAAVQIVPTIDHAGDSVRAGGLSFKTASDWSMPPARLGQFLFPNVLGYLDLDGRSLYWGSRLYPERSLPFLYSIYPGLLFAVLALAGLFAKVRGRGLTLTIGLASIVIALGSHTPFWPLLHELGVLNLLRYPEKFILMAVFASIVFGSRVLDELLAGSERVRRSAWIIALAVAIAAALAAVFTRTPLYPQLFLDLFRPTPDRAVAMLAAFATTWVVATGRAAAVVILVRTAESRRRWIVPATLFVIVDLGLILYEAVPRIPPGFYDEPPAVARQLPANRGEWRLFHHAAWHKQRPVVRPYFEPHPDLYWVYRNSMMPMIPAQHGVRMALDPDYDLTALRPTADFEQSVADLSGLRPDWVDVAASMSNVWYRAVFRDPAEAFREAGGDRRAIQPVGILGLERYPRYFFAERVEPIRDRSDFVRKLAGRRFGKRTAFVSGAGFDPAAGRVTGVRETANTARIEVETDGRAFLVISVTPHKYWRVTVDRAEAEAVVTNVGYQGVAVPGPGRHVVEMRYRNPLVLAGGMVSLLSLLALAFITMRRL